MLGWCFDWFGEGSWVGTAGFVDLGRELAYISRNEGGTRVARYERGSIDVGREVKIAEEGCIEAEVRPLTRSCLLKFEQTENFFPQSDCEH